jgi:AhpD family alkylhydroperoxidase
MKVQVFDPPMCCATGVCGAAVDPKLVQFAADLEWLAQQGVEVERFNLSQQPRAFVDATAVRAALEQVGNDALPLTLVDGAVACKGKYPTRDMLAGYAKLETERSIVTDAVRELVAIGAAVASNCESCFKYHYNEARKLGVSKDDMRLAVDTAQAVKDAPARSVLALADKYLADRRVASSQASPCCSGADTPAGGKCCG